MTEQPKPFHYPKPVQEAIENYYPMYWRVRYGTIYSYELMAVTYTYENGIRRTRRLVQYIDHGTANRINSHLIIDGCALRPTLHSAIAECDRRRQSE